MATSSCNMSETCSYARLWRLHACFMGCGVSPNLKEANVPVMQKSISHVMAFSTRPTNISLQIEELTPRCLVAAKGQIIPDQFVRHVNITLSSECLVSRNDPKENRSIF